MEFKKAWQGMKDINLRSNVLREELKNKYPDVKLPKGTMCHIIITPIFIVFMLLLIIVGASSNNPTGYMINVACFIVLVLALKNSVANLKIHILLMVEKEVTKRSKIEPEDKNE